MAVTAEELRVLVTAEVERALQNLRSFDNGLSATQSKLSKFGDNAIKVGGKLTKFITLPLAAIGVAAVKSAADVEKQAVALRILTGDAETANKVLQEVEAFAATTPFQFPGLVDGAKRLIAVGVASEEVIDRLKALGNAAQGDTQIFNRLVDAFAKLRTKGRASLEELNRFSEAGVPIIESLAEQYAVSREELFKLIETGQVGFQDVNDALTALTTGQGRFAGLIEAQSQTLSGSLSTLKDNVGLAARSFVEGFLPVLTDIAQELTKAAKFVASLDDDTKKLILTVAGIAAATGPAITAIGALSKAIAFLAANPLVAVVGGLAAATVAIQALNNAKIDEKFGDAAEQIGVSNKELSSAVSLVQDLVRFDLGQPFEVAEAFIGDISKELGISKQKLIDIVVSQEDTSKLLKEQLNILSEQIKERETLKELSSTEGLINEKLFIRQQQLLEAEERRRKAQQEREEALKREEELRAKLARTAQERAQFEQDFNTRLLQQAGDRVALLEREKSEAISVAKEIGADRVLVERFFNAEIEKARQQDLDSRNATLKEIERVEMDAVNRRIKSQELAAQRAKEISEATKQKQIKDIQAVANVASSIFSALAETSSLAYQSVANNASEATDAQKAEARKAFETQKAANIAQTLIATATGAVEAYKALAGIPFIGPALGIAAAGALTIFGLGKAREIAATKPAFQQGTPPEGFTVPEGFPNDDFSIGVSSGENVSVTDSDEVAGASSGFSQVNLGDRSIDDILTFLFRESRNGRLFIDERSLVRT